MIKKSVGYVLAGIGVVGLACGTFAPLRDALFLPASLSSGVLTSLSLVIVVAGAATVYLSGKSNNKGKEVPIYEGKKVVGYRRI